MADTSSKGFPGDYISAADLVRFSGKPPGKPLFGRWMVLDYPIKAIDKYIANVCPRMNWANYQNPAAYIANEGAAALAVLFAAGYTPLEVFQLRATGKFDPVNLIEGQTKITGRMHIQKRGADHKGLHFRDAIDRLIREKIGESVGIDPITPVTFAEFHQKRAVGLYITALDVSTASVITLSFASHPNMVVADAVLASCAVQPYIRSVIFKEEKTEHVYMSCSNIYTFPYSVAVGIAKEQHIPAVESLIVGYGCAETANEAGVKNATGSVLVKAILSKRAAAIIPKNQQNIQMI